MDRCRKHGKRTIGGCAVHACSMCCLEANPDWKVQGFVTCVKEHSPQARGQG